MTNPNEIEKHSTLKLMFGQCSAWQLIQKTPTERETIFECTADGRRGGKYDGDRFSQSRYWRIMCQRVWQYDDFTYEGVAAASYLLNAHRYKMWFNPLEYYRMVMTAGLFEREENLSPEKALLQQEAFKIQWEMIIKGEQTIYDDKLRKRGWNIKLWKLLEKCVELKGWTFDAWIEWNNAIVTNKLISQNLESVLIHEILHITHNHLARVEERDHFQWNISTDYSINQTLNFTEEIRQTCITRDNKSFWQRFVVSVIKYIMSGDLQIRKDIEDNFKITMDTEFSKIKPKVIDQLYDSYMTESAGWAKEDKFANKSADLYYRILLETCVFVGGSGVSGYDSHDKWNDQGEESDEGTEESEQDGKEKGKGKDPDKNGKGAADNTETCKAAEKGDKADAHPDTSEKERGKGGREEHKGFQNMEMAAARQEVKQSVKEALERCGVNIDDPAEIEKALKAIPAMGILGAQILEWFKIRKKNWKQLLKKEMTSFINPQDMDYTMSREHRAMPGTFPGKKRERGLDVIVQMDTSGSINYKDWNDFCGQIEEIGRSCDANIMRVLQVHSVIASDTMVNLRKIKQMKIKETGGTTMQLGPAKLLKEKNKKLLLIFTDGYIDTFLQKDYNFKIIMFLSRGNAHMAGSLEERGFKVITQDEE